MVLLLYDILLAHQLKWNIPLLFSFILLLLFYMIFLLKYEKWMFKTTKPFLFLSGVCLLYMITGTPLAVMSHLLFSTHMLQMSLFYFIIPPLLLFGFPNALSQKIKKLNSIAYSTFCLMLFSFLLYIYHIPLFLEFITTELIIHELYSWILFGLSIVMWIPITFSSLTYDLSRGQQPSYVMLSAWLITPACIFLLLPHDGGNPLFLNMVSLCIPKEYVDELLAPPIDDKYDQQIAGMIMFLVHKAGMSVTLKLESIVNGNK